MPQGRLLRKIDPRALASLRLPLVLKAQVPRGGRGKAGAVVFVKTRKELREKLAALLDKDVLGYRVREVLAEAFVDIERELYLAFLVEPHAHSYTLLCSAHGGVDVEELAREHLHTYQINPWLGIPDFLLRELACALGLPRTIHNTFADFAKKLYAAFVEQDATLLEINPLVVTREKELVVVDAKLVIDDDARFRHAELPREQPSATAVEKKARAAGIAFVELGGKIGVIANGAGLTLATIDLLHKHGGSAAFFLDLGGGVSTAKVVEALRLASSCKASALLINIFGGITRCDEVARGICEVAETSSVPLVVRMRGTRETAARNMLAAVGISAHINLEDAVRKVTSICSAPAAA
jgi:succinyl-CoA synthetase beta subunit